MGTTSGTSALVFSVTNPFGDTVTLTVSDWTGHVLIGHPEMAGKEHEVKGTVESPDRIRESTLNASVIYESDGTSVGLMRVIVQSDEPTKAITGGTSGEVATAYPRDVRRYPNPRIGKVIWSKPTPPVTKETP